MRSVVIPALLVAALPALAQEAPALLSALSGDWDGNGIADAVVLVPGPENSASLIVYRGDGASGLAPVLTLPGVAFAGPWAGQAPTLAPLGARGFVLRSEQTGIGPTPWMQAITVIWQESEFLIAGYDYSFYDRLDLEHSGDCSVNLLIRRYTLSHSPGGDAPEIRHEGMTEAAAFPLASLTGGYMAAPCQQLFD